jgi:hypothetical protein
VRSLYNEGVAEAKNLNRLTANKIIQMLKLDVAAKDVVLSYNQPKGNEKKYVVTGVKFGSELRAVPPGFSYIVPPVLGKKKADEIKKRMPGVTFAGVFQPERNTDYFLRACGLYFLDFDAVKDLGGAWKTICEDTNVAVAFVSVTGSGLKVGVYGPHATNSAEYAEIYERIAELKAQEWKLVTEVDRATKDSARLCFLPHDKDAYINWSARQLTLGELPKMHAKAPVKALESTKVSGEWKPIVPEAESVVPASTGELPLTINWGEVPNLSWQCIPLARVLDALKYIDPSTGREPWRLVGAALKLAYGDEAFESFDAWSAHGGLAYTGSDACRKLWDGHKRSDDGNAKVVTPRSILKLARQNGWKPDESSKQSVGMKVDERGRIALPMFGTGFTAGEFCAELYGHMAKQGTAFLRGGQVCKIVHDPESGGKKIEIVDAASMATWIENFADVYTSNKNGDKLPTSVGEKSGRVILKADQRYDLPPLESIVEMPVLAEVNGELVLAESGYNRPLRTFVLGEQKLPKVASLTAAKDTILSMLKDYEFSTPHDMGLAVSAILTPALKLGGFIKGHVPIFFFEANESQSGKSKLAELVGAVYGEEPTRISQRFKGVGSVDESISRALLKGCPFILIDNWRGDLDSQFLECVVTSGGRVDARALRTAADVNADRYIFFLTSNGMSATTDLCNRAALVRIVKRQGYRFPFFPEGSLPNHVRANCHRYLSAVFHIVEEWHRLGKPRTDEARHSFAEWAGALDWIIQNLFGLSNLLDGNAEALARVKHRDLAVLRQLCMALEKDNKFDCILRPSRIADVAVAAHVILGVDVAGKPDGAAMAVGKILKNSFDALGGHAQSHLLLEGFHIRRKERKFQRQDGLGTKDGWVYQFSRSAFADLWPDDIAGDALGGD